MKIANTFTFISVALLFSMKSLGNEIEQESAIDVFSKIMVVFAKVDNSFATIDYCIANQKNTSPMNRDLKDELNKEFGEFIKELEGYIGLSHDRIKGFIGGKEEAMTSEEFLESLKETGKRSANSYQSEKTKDKLYRTCADNIRYFKKEMSGYYDEFKSIRPELIEYFSE